MRFSVIIPVYKVEDYINEAVESVLKQDEKGFEVILVDDGSPDACPRICEDLALKDARIKVIHKQNGGASSARNIGIEEATGEYIVFLDGDDCLVAGALSKVSQEIEQENSPELLICNFVHWYNNEEYIVVDNGKYKDWSKYLTLPEICEKFAEKNVQLPWRPYQSIIRRDVLMRYNLRYDPTIAAAEDCDFFIKLLPKIKNYVVSNIVLVKYRAFREGSLINTQRFAAVMGQLKIFAEASKNANKFPNEKLMQRYFADRFCNIIILIEALNNKKEREVCYEYISNNKLLLKYTSAMPKYIVAKALWQLLGFERGNRFLIFIKKRGYKHEIE